ncbi:hypothetical protein [Salisediminibacterium beveridgei]|uniref:hypothetical protein n=1 Tax=Salisediminibacterium beveridgei TaxID=632773 RepID=UPI0012ED654B|nr:hypothetical protein [Salisediminibacterium beveridgei]
MDHVKGELAQSGVKKPRLSAVSSKQGLLAKQRDVQDVSGFHQFEKKFYNEMVHRLKTLSYERAEQLYSRYLKRANDWALLLKSGNEELHQYKKQLIDSSMKAKQAVNVSSFQAVKGYTFQELDEMILFLRQRMTYQMSDLFKEHINVSTVNADSRKELKYQFSEAVQGYVLNVEQYANREMTTLLIRLENKVNDQIRHWLQELLNEIRIWIPHLNDAEIQQSLDINDMEMSFVLSINAEDYIDKVHSKKELFVRQTVKEIKEKMISDTEEVMMHYLQEWKRAISHSLEDKLRQAESAIKSLIKHQSEQDEVRLSKLNDPNELERLKKEITLVRKYHLSSD